MVSVAQAAERQAVILVRYEFESHRTPFMETMMLIRQPTIADAPVLANVQIESWRAGYRDILPARVIDEIAAQRLERWQKNLSESSTYRYLLCELDGQVAGLAIFSPSRDEGDDKQITAELCALYVHPSFWNRGCGRALTNAVIECVRQGNWRELIVWCLTDNHPSRRFYEKVGFTLDGKTKNIMLAGESFAEVRFRTAL